MEKYDIMSVVGEGSYGIVMKCRHRESGQYVAIKKFLETEDDLNVRKMALREIRMLKKLRHENLVNMIEVFRRKKRFFLVFEYLEHTILEELETRSGGLGFVTSRKYIYQVLRALDFIHSNNVIHRDIKPENVLVSRSGVIKLCDFGFARPFADNETFTDYVATRWYRSPELLVGDPRYGKEVDIWAVGCLYSEMMTGDPLFPGESDIDQLFQIVRILGKLNSRHQILVTRNTMFKGMKQEQNSSLSQLFPDWNRDCLEFLTKCLRMDGNLRPDTSILLKHELFMKDDFLDNFLPELRTKINQEMQRNPLLTRVNGFGSGRKQVEEKKQVQPEKPPPPAVGPKKSLEDSKPLQLNSKERITQIGLSLFPATQPTNHFKLTTGGVEEFNLNLTSYKHYLSQKTNGNNINGNNNNVKPINLTFKETGKYSRVLSAKPQRTNIIDKNQQTTIQQNSEHQLQSSPVQFQSLQTDGSQGQTEKLSPMNVNNLTISGNISQYFNNKRSTNILGLQKVVNNNNNNNKQSPTPLNFVTRNNLVKRDRGVLLDVGLTPYGFSGLTTAGGTTTGTINNDPSKEASPRLPPPQWLTGNLKVSSQGKTTQIGKRGITDWKTISNNNNKTIGDGNDFVLPNCPGASISPYKGLKKKLTPMATISHDMTPRIQSPPPKTHESTS